MTADDAAPPAPRPAGVVTRLMAAAIDLAVVLVLLGLVLLITAGLRFLWSPVSFSWPAPSSGLAFGIGALLAVGYLTGAWTATGRTYGGALLGLRVVGGDGHALAWVRAVLRAVLSLLVPIGLLWVAVSPARRSLQDAVVGSTVVYDWQGAGARR